MPSRHRDRRLLIVDDEPTIRFGLRDFFEAQGFTVDEAGDTAEALESMREHAPNAVVLDHVLPHCTALEALPQMRKLDPGVPLVILTAHGSIDLAVQAMQQGADDFLTKPIQLPALLKVIETLLDGQRDMRRRARRLTANEWATADPFIGTCSAVRELRAQARRLVGSDRPVLIIGETGAGKGVLARWLHAAGRRSDQAFVDLNCAALSRDLLESELFGHERGAYTGAVSTKIGLFEAAHHGTLFLDEIGDLDAHVQAKLLKVLEEQRFRRLGEVHDRRADVRLIAATHQDIPRLVRENRFRRDLYFRISTLPLRVPPLRERTEDIPLLARDILNSVSADLGRDPVELTPDALAALVEHSWPGNVRELRNVLERAVLMADRGCLQRGDLQFESQVSSGACVAASLTLRELERLHIERVLRSESGCVARAAQRLGIPRSSLYHKLKAYGLDKAAWSVTNSRPTGEPAP